MQFRTKTCTTQQNLRFVVVQTTKLFYRYVGMPHGCGLYRSIFIPKLLSSRFSLISQWAFTCSKLTIETLEQGTLCVSIVNFEQVNAHWDNLESTTFSCTINGWNNFFMIQTKKAWVAFMGQNKDEKLSNNFKKSDFSESVQHVLGIQNSEKNTKSNFLGALE